MTESFVSAYNAQTPTSKALFERASKTIPGGAGSSARTVKFGWSPYPPFMRQGTGSHLTDVDGNEYIDYLLGLGPMILGHRHPVITQAVADAIAEYGTCFGLPYELEIEAAEKVVAAVPGIEKVRFTNSGSEAVGSAVRLARAHTGRRLIVRFEGHYHGWQDTIYWSNHVDPKLAGPKESPRPVASGPGVPLELTDTLVVLSWNDPESFVKLMNERGHEIAAVITEPAVFNTGCILPEPGYLELLRSETIKHGSLLIFDEVITGFRFARGCAQEFFGVTPDLTTLAKGLGGGFPVAALGGSIRIRERITRMSLPVLLCQRRWMCLLNQACMNGSAPSATVSPKVCARLPRTAELPRVSMDSGPSSSSGSLSMRSKTGVMLSNTQMRQCSLAGGKK